MSITNSVAAPRGACRAFVITRSVRCALIAATLACVSSLVQAQDVADSQAQLPPVTVTATMTTTPIDHVGSSVSVITEEEIARNQWRSLPDALRAQAGLNVVQTGSAGGTTSVYMRGTNANHTKVLIDGIEVSDPSNNGFDFAQILIGDIERIEVLRGPQSGLYGSDAIGGVISVTTKKGRGPARFTAQAEAGSFETFNQAIGLSGGGERYNYAFGFNHTRIGDTPVTPANLLGPGQTVMGDRADNKTYSAKLGAELSDVIDVDFVARYIDSVLRNTNDDFSGFPTVVPNSAQSEQDQKQLYTRGALRANLWGGAFQNEFGVGYMQSRREFLDPGPSFSSFDADRVKYDWRGTVKVTEGQTLVLGLEDATDSLNDSPTDIDLNNRAGYATYQWDVNERLGAAASLRHDDNETFGGATTYRLAPSYRLPGTETRLKASYGTGFKAPTLTDLFVDFPAFFFFSNPNLQPEESRGYDIGFEQPLGGRVTAGATHFHNDIKNLIQSNGTTSVNIGQATTYGFETFVSWAVDDRLSLRADHTFTFTIAENDATGGPLNRRPKHKASLTAAWDATDKLTLSGSAIFVGGANDINRYGTVSNLRSDSYLLVNLAANYELTERVSLFGRVENLLDREYESPIGFERPGVGAFAGLKVNFQVGD